jgi:hypothetical protein
MECWPTTVHQYLPVSVLDKHAWPPNKPLIANPLPEDGGKDWMRYGLGLCSKGRVARNVKLGDARPSGGSIGSLGARPMYPTQYFPWTVYHNLKHHTFGRRGTG